MGVWFIGVTFGAAERGSWQAVAAGVVITERMLRRRDLGPVTLDLVHAPEDEGAARRGS